MGYWRKQQPENHRQVGHWGSSSYNRKPPLHRQNSTVPSWEKEFCISAGVPWGKIIDTKKYMHLYDDVVKWKDSASKEAFDNAKSRFWAMINGFPCDLPLPDPDTESGNVDWDASDDPELYLDLDREPMAPSEEERGEEVIIGLSLLTNQQFSGAGWGPTGWGDDEAELKKPAEPNSAAQGWESNLHEKNLGPTGWGDDEAEVTKPAEPNSAAQGWESNLHENNGGPTGWGDDEEQWTKPAELNFAAQGWESNLHENKGGPTAWGDDEEELTKPAEPNSTTQGWESNLHENNETNSAKEYGWQNGQNDTQRWNQREQAWNQRREDYGGDFPNKSKGRNDGNGNWGACEGYNRLQRENMTWSRNPGYHGNEFQMNRGRRNNRGGRGRGGGGGRGRGGRRGNFGYDHSYVDKVPSGTG